MLAFTRRCKYIYNLAVSPQVSVHAFLANVVILFVKNSCRAAHLAALSLGQHGNAAPHCTPAKFCLISAKMMLENTMTTLPRKTVRQSEQVTRTSPQNKAGRASFRQQPTSSILIGIAFHTRAAVWHYRRLLKDTASSRLQGFMENRQQTLPVKRLVNKSFRPDGLGFFEGIIISQGGDHDNLCIRMIF